MSAPSYVPQDPSALLRYYESPPRRPESWPLQRPSELEVGAEQPRGGRFGNQGPDIGYAYKLFHLVHDKIHLVGDESMEDVEQGVVAVAMRRASLFSRGPILADVEIGCTVWGFFDAQPSSDLVKTRRDYFESASGHYFHRLIREIAAAVPDEVLAKSPTEIAAAQKANWSSVLDVT